MAKIGNPHRARIFIVELPTRCAFLPHHLQGSRDKQSQWKARIPYKSSQDHTPLGKENLRQSPDYHHQLRPQVEPTDVISRDEQITNLNILADVVKRRNRVGDQSKCLLPAKIAVDSPTCKCHSPSEVQSRSQFAKSALRQAQPYHSACLPPNSSTYPKSKPPRYFTMTSASDSVSSHSSSRASREQNVEAQAEADAAVHISEQGASAGMKHRSNSISVGSSISQFGNSASIVVSENLATMKGVMMDDALPRAQEALQTVGGQIQALTNGKKEPEESTSGEVTLTSEEHECIDTMDNERVCDFLRENHMSTTRPRKTH